jgi:alpha-N-arabinofuranosidase
MKARLTLHTAFQTGAVDPRIFGGFLEHMGRAVYQGVYQPGAPGADSGGLRADLRQGLARLSMTTMRYPGGNFASGYHWRDGVGPRQARPSVRDLAWQSIEPNSFGTDELITLCGQMGWSPVLAVNLGTGSPEEARDWVEYCNCPAGTRFADMRAAGGHVEPHGVGLWCLGNEMDGPWQIGHVPAAEYALRAQQAAKMMKDVDRSIELVAAGTCVVDLPTYMEWDRQVLEYLGDLADYLSIHRYAANRSDDTEDFLAVTAAIDRQIEEADAACRFVQAKRRSRKRASIAFDEWNVWYKNMEMDGRGQHAPHLIEEVYNLEDALVVAGFLNSFIRHADVVKMASIAQIVNVIAPIMTREEGLLVQSTFYPFEMISRRRTGVSLRVSHDGPTYDGRTHGSVPVIDSSAILNRHELSVFMTNRSVSQAATVTIDIADRTIAALASGEILAGPGPKAQNTWQAPDVVRSHALEGVTVKNGAATVELPALSFAAATFRLE